MTDAPINPVIVDASAVSKSAVRSYERDTNRIRVTNAAWVQSRDLSDTFGFDLVGRNYDRDTSDTTTADDGVSCIVDIVGTRFKLTTMPTVASRIKLTAARSVTIGAGQDFTTMQAGWNDHVSNYDTAGFTTTFKLIDATHTAALLVSVGWVGGGQVVFDRLPTNAGLTNQSTVTITNGVNNGVAWVAHGLTAGKKVYFIPALASGAPGTMPTGLTAGQTYFVIAAGLTANSFRVSATLAGAAVDTTGSAGTGTITAYLAPNVQLSITGTAFDIEAPLPAPITVQNMAITASSVALKMNAQGTLKFKNIVFGAGVTHIESLVPGGTVELIGSYVIAGSASGMHLYAIGGFITTSNFPIPIVGSPAFGTGNPTAYAFAYAEDLGLITVSTAWNTPYMPVADPNHGATGPRLHIGAASKIGTNGQAGLFATETYFPGNSVGTVSTGTLG